MSAAHERCQPKPAELRRNPPVCVHCDADLSCGACGMEQPYDDISLLKARIHELEGALKGLVARYDHFQTTHGDQASAYYSLVKGAYSQWDAARAAVEAKPAGEMGK